MSRTYTIPDTEGMSSEEAAAARRTAIEETRAAAEARVRAADPTIGEVELLNAVMLEVMELTVAALTAVEERFRERGRLLSQGLDADEVRRRCPPLGEVTLPD